MNLNVFKINTLKKPYQQKTLIRSFYNKYLIYDYLIFNHCEFHLNAMPRKFLNNVKILFRSQGRFTQRWLYAIICWTKCPCEPKIKKHNYIKSTWFFNQDEFHLNAMFGKFLNNVKILFRSQGRFTKLWLYVIICWMKCPCEPKIKSIVILNLVIVAFNNYLYQSYFFEILYVCDKFLITRFFNKGNFRLNAMLVKFLNNLKNIFPSARAFHSAMALCYHLLNEVPLRTQNKKA